jgi:hypothetical protein
MSSSASSNTLWDRVIAVLAEDNFRQFASDVDRRPLIEMANSLGGPPMRLVHWKRLDYLGRIPHYDEQEAVHAVAAIEAFGARSVEVFMVSHRWLRPSLDRKQAHPDGPGNEKAEALNQFSLWRRQWVLHYHGFLPEIYYWIDYTCIDQNNTADAVVLLPLWVACCERFVRIETDDYEERTWCRVEQLLSYVFSFADHHVSIGSDFQYHWPYRGTVARPVIRDPRTGKLTNPEDMRLILPLVELAVQIRPTNSTEKVLRLNETSVKCHRL